MEGEMNQFLAEYYGTNAPAQASSEDQEKQAQVELFSKLAADQGIDLSKAKPEEIEYAWGQFQVELQKSAGAETKVAEKDPHADEEKKEVKARELLQAAEKEHSEKKAAAEKFAEADYLGRVMAHAYVAELKKIAGENPFAKMQEKKDEKGEEKGDDKKPEDKKPEEKKEAMPDHLRAALDKIKSASANKVAAAAPKTEKRASAIDTLASERALTKAAAAGFNADEAAVKLAGVLELGAASTKIASVQDLETALEIRSLELLESAGYPVTWAQ